MFTMNESVTYNHLFQVLFKGGWVMLPLLLCSIIALGVILERIFWGPKKNNVLPERFIKEVKDLLSKGRYEQALGLCRAEGSSLSRIICAALKNVGRSREQILEATQSAGRREALVLQKNLGILGTIAAISPLLGLLGTVFGMINTFNVIQSQGVGNAQALAGGISEALITTAAGLTIAIPTLVFHRYFLHQSRQLVSDMEEITLHILDDIIQINPVEGSRERGTQAL